ncbi:hypothetical protein [Vibrio owensii]|uniref:hypothetical protein n=1 Tax=Vibrio harveyi group TaxID=717610 RepID=UPI003CC5FD4C
MTITIIITFILTTIFTAGFEAIAAGAATGIIASFADYAISFMPKKYAPLMLLMKIMGTFAKLLVLIFAFMIASSFDIISHDHTDSFGFVISLIVAGVISHILITKKISGEHEK